MDESGELRNQHRDQITKQTPARPRTFRHAAGKVRPLGEAKIMTNIENGKDCARESVSEKELSPDKTSGDFESLIDKERKALNPQVQDGKGRKISTSGPADEPWVAFTTEDRVGLALSGGGIRSATFNLGLLQALREKDVLKHVDYLATVSGGGYVGGFWTRWWQWRVTDDNKSFEKDFPQATGNADGKETGGPKEIREPAEIRHLREFSRFLIPRKGLTAEFWSAAITILTGLVPSLMAAMAAVLLAMAVWAYAAAWMILPKNDVGATEAPSAWSWLCERMLHPHAPGIAAAFTVLTAVVLVVAEWIARRAGRFEVAPSIRSAFTWYYALWTSVALLGSWAGWRVWNIWQPAPTHGVSLGLGEPGYYAQPYSFNCFLFGPCVALLVAVAILTALRLISGRSRKDAPTSETRHDPHPSDSEVKHGRRIARSASLERVMGRLLAIQVVWAAMAGVWELARWLIVEAGRTESISGVGGVTAVLAFLFYQVQGWLTQPNQDGSGRKVLKWLKPWAPQLLANGIVVLLFVLAAVFILSCGLLTGDYWPKGWILLGCLAMLGLMLVLFDPKSVGLHEFYRARLTRCYLGASQPQRSNDRVSVECPDDDMPLKSDSGKPIHLICCAANHLWGDPLSTLHRGARSAVLSRHGIAIGNYWIGDDDLWLSSAMTASAAAFNSLMGELNMTLGRAVAFVMTALNLRLGLWVKNPACGEPRHFIRKVSWWFSVWFPGRFYIREMFAWAQCPPLPADDTQKNGSKCRAEKHVAAYVHLSDGGHFENLAFYELIRRHCRYIIVADAGEDHAFAFTDFGRAARRVREDFGVEVEIDLTLLQPGPDQLSKQHVAVGTIHYDGVVGTDKGTIVYFKPTLTGDEPVDVLQYRQRKPIFPHESTGDQFFDEAQWESYRRLGEHTGHAGLRILEELPVNDDSSSEAKSMEKLFREVRLYWQRVPWMQGDAGIRLCEHAAALEGALHEHACPGLLKEFVGGMLGAVPVVSATDGSAKPPASAEQTASDVFWAIRAFKFIEEAWVVCELDRYWSHPRAANWMSYLQHWAAMPTLRHWWPLLKPLFGDRFQRFAGQQLHLPTADCGHQVIFELVPRDENADTGFAWRRLLQCQPGFALDGGTCFSLKLTLPNTNGPLCIQAGLAVVHVENSVASWHIDDLFVPPELRGGGITTQLLDKLIGYFKNNLKAEPDKQARLKVRMKDKNRGGSKSPIPTRLRRDQAGRQEQIELIGFYRSRGFQFDYDGWDKRGQNTRMVLRL